MKNQLFQVFKTYWARRSNVLLFCLLLIGLLVLNFLGRGRTSSIPLAPSLSFPTPYESLASGPQGARQLQKPDTIRTLSLFIIDKLETPDLTSYTHVRRLNLSANALSEKLIADLPFLSKLRSLELKTPNIPVGMLASMGGNLEELSISSKVLREHANELHQMSALKLLIIDNTDWSREVFEAIATIPQLRYLVVKPEEFARDPLWTPPSEYFQRSGLNPTAEALLALQDHPQLQGIFINLEDRINDVQENLVDLPVYPLAISDDPTPKIICLNFVMITVTILVLSQLSTLMLLPVSMTTPRFIQPHLIVSASILSVGVLIVTLTLIQFRIAVLPSLSLALFGNLIWILMSPESTLAKPRESRFGKHQLRFQFFKAMVSAVVIYLPLFMILAVPPHLRAQLYQYLEGDFPGFALLVIVLEMILIVIWFLRAKLRARMIMEASP